MSSRFLPASREGHLHAGDRAAAFGVRVGDAEGVGRRAVAEDLAVDRCAALLGVLVVFEHDHRRAFAEHEAVAVAGRTAATPSAARRCCSERAVSRLKPVTPNGWIMLWAPPESITSASPRRMISVASPMAWLLAAQAVRQLTFGPWALNMRRQVAGRHVRLLLELELRIEPLEALRG